MALVLDTGPLFAAMDVSDKDHTMCSQLIAGSDETVVIPAPVLVEVDWLVGHRLKQQAFVTLLLDINEGRIRVENVQEEDYRRCRELISRYGDLALGFVDAAVMAIVERLREPKLATLDHRHFEVVRPKHVPALRLLP